MWLFGLAGAWIFVANAIGCAFVLGTAALYSFLLSDPVMSFTVTQLELTILEYMPATIVVSYAAVAGHAILAIRTARNFIRQCWLSKRSRSVRASRVPTVRGKLGPTQSAIALVRSPSSTAASTALNSLAFRIRARVRFFTTRFRRRWTRYGPEITRLFMIWEVANQTFQAHKISQLVASVWVNRLVSTVIVINCWFSPVLYWAMRGRRQCHIRLARLLLDSCLDFVYGIGIPVVIFYPYYRDYVDTVSIFPTLLYYSDTWYVSALSELRQVFVTSWVDLVSKTTGSVALLYRLYVVENVLRDAQDPHFVSRRDTTSTVQQVGNSAVPPTHHRRWRSRLAKVLDAILIVWGLAVLTLHVHSTIVAIRGDQLGCLLEMRPWAVTTYSCGVLEISCVQHHTVGQHPAIIDALDNVGRDSLQVLIVSHCEQLEVPAILQNYSALVMIKVYNTTIASWGADAALRDATHPVLKVLYFARVNMTEIPPGLLARDFPRRVWDIELCMTNLTTFPAAIVEAWRNAVYVVVEANWLMTEISEALLRLPVMAFLQLGMNQIASLPPWAFADREFVNLYLDGNPLTELPEAIKSLTQMRRLGLRNTNISTLPVRWLNQKVPNSGLIALEADGSPLCGDGAEARDGRILGPLSITCHSGKTSLITYPLAAEDEWRAPSASVES